VLRRTSCPAHSGYKWSTNELLVLLQLLFQNQTIEILVLSQYDVVAV